MKDDLFDNLNELREQCSNSKNTPCSLHAKLLSHVVEDFREAIAHFNSAIKEIESIKASVEILEEKVIRGNGDVSLIVRMDRLEQAKISNDALKKMVTGAVIKTLVPILLLILAMGVVFAAGAGKYIQTSNSEEIRSIIKETINEQIHDAVNPFADSRLRNNSK